MRMGKKRFALLYAVSVFSAALIWGAPAHAYNSDAALERDGTLCTRQVTRAERQYGIPQRLLAAIAATETGQYHKGLGVKIPWPWVINVEGKPYFFDNKVQAIAAVEKFQRQGKTSIDVGCMQINLKHHPDAFTSLNQAFDPRYNVDYAARFLLGHYQETQAWKTAVGRYHSRTPGYAARYVGLVYNQWYGLASKGNTAVASTAPRSSSKRYKSYVQVEGGDQVVFSKGAKNPSRKVVAPTTAKEENIIRSATREPVRSDFELSIIRPASAAGTVETAPTQSSESIASPLVMNMGEAKGFTTPKVLSIGAEAKSEAGDDSRFIRFVD